MTLQEAQRQFENDTFALIGKYAKLSLPVRKAGDEAAVKRIEDEFYSEWLKLKCDSETRFWRQRDRE